MAFMILSTEIVYQSKKCHSEIKKKTEKDIIRDTWSSITYYFTKYHVILCQVSRDTFLALFFEFVV